MSVNIRPLQDRILVKQLEEEDKSAGGIIIPDSAQEKPSQGKIVAAGNGKVLEDGNVRPPLVKVGDRVLFEKYAGTTIKVEGEDYMVMREDDVLAIVK